ncbi:hypothetical protein ASE02_21405 [Phenylobacterium sp. Root700]|nr:hypothetical protein ASE02_21405 [Phenylobacterium sp. Root700]
MLVPSGDYGAVKTFSRSSYDLTLSDGRALTITMVANTAHIRSTSTDTDTGNQLNVLIVTDAGQPGAVLLGDTIVGRTCHLNPTAVQMTIRPRASYGAGSGSLITITSEEVDNSLDASGNPARNHGFKIGALWSVSASSGNVLHPIKFQSVQFYRNVHSTQAFFDQNNASGYGYRFDDCKISCGPSVATPVNNPGFDLNRGSFVTNCTFTNCGKCLSALDGTLTASRNIFGPKMRNDAIALSKGDHVVTDNFFYDWNWVVGNHPDSIQHNAISNDQTYSIGTIARNISVRGAGTPGFIDAQGFFARNQTHSDSYDGTVAINNIFGLTMANMFWLSTQANPNYSYNTALADFAQQPVVTDDPPGSNPNSFLKVDSNLDGTLTAGGAGYVDGTYGAHPAAGVPLTGGGGSGMLAQLTVTGGAVTDFVIRKQGSGYAVGDVLGVAASSVGGAGSGFQLTTRSLAGSGGTFNGNLVNALDLSANTTIVSQLNNVPLPIFVDDKSATLARYRGALPNYTGDPADLNTRAKVLLAYTPLAGGTAMSGGSYAGALFPATAGETTGAWNDGSAFDPGNPTWVASHPPAT